MKNVNINYHVAPICSPRSGCPVRNQYTIEGPNYTAFQSYGSLCAVRSSSGLTLGYDWDYSVTTRKYLAIWLRTYCPDIVDQLPDGRSLADRLRKAIDAGIIGYDMEMS